MKNTAKNLNDTAGQENKKPDLSALIDKKNTENLDLPGYPIYAPEEDIYNKAKEETELDPEDPTQLKQVEQLGEKNEKDFES
jgi:hypothetical protein